MTVLVKHIKEESGRDELVFRNGKNTVLFTLGDDQGKSGIAFDIYEGENCLAGFNCLGQRMSGPYNNSYATELRKINCENFESEGKRKRFVFVEGVAAGIPNRPIFTVDKEPFDHITFCDGEGNTAIDMEIDKDGRLSSICRAKNATTKDNLVVMFEDEKNPKLNKTVDLNKTSDYHLDGAKSIGTKTKISTHLSTQHYPLSLGIDPNGYERFETNDAGKKEICACDTDGNLIYTETSKKASNYDYKLRHYWNGLQAQLIDSVTEKGLTIATDKKRYSIKNGTPKAKIFYCLDKDGKVDPSTVVIVRDLKQGVLAMGSKGMETVKLFNDIHKKHPIALTQSKGKELSDK